MSDVAYAVKVRPSLVGYRASVSKKTRLRPMDDDDEDFWMGWTPEPSYWRPTSAWAVRRAARKRRRLEASERRRAAERVVAA